MRRIYATQDAANSVYALYAAYMRHTLHMRSNGARNRAKMRIKTSMTKALGSGRTQSTAITRVVVVD